MARKLVKIALLAVLALGLFAGCTIMGEQGNAIIGSIFIDDSMTVLYGGTEYHVLVYDLPESVDPTSTFSVEDLNTVARFDGILPGTVSDLYFTINYVITGVPVGEYFVFVWIEEGIDGEYTPYEDAMGFYDYDRGLHWTSIPIEPTSPNVVVPAIGVVDVDVWIGELPPPEV